MYNNMSCVMKLLILAFRNFPPFWKWPQEGHVYIIIFAVNILSCYKYTYDFKTVYFDKIKGRGARGTYLAHGKFLSGLVFRMFRSGNMYL